MPRHFRRPPTSTAPLNNLSNKVPMRRPINPHPLGRPIRFPFINIIKPVTLLLLPLPIGPRSKFENLRRSNLADPKSQQAWPGAGVEDVACVEEGFVVVVVVVGGGGGWG